MAETFGKTGKGLTEYMFAEGNRIWACKYQSGSAGTLQTMSVYIKKYLAVKIKCAIYDSSKDLVPDGTTEELDIEAEQDGWMHLDFLTPPSVSAATDYWLCLWSPDYNRIYYDAGSSDQTFKTSNTYIATWPASLMPVEYQDWEVSIYATYTEAAAKKTLVQATLISISPLIVLPTLAEILKFAGVC